MNNIAIKIIQIYRGLISPFLGQRCRFYPSCSSYAQEAFGKKAFFQAAGLTLKRLLKCHPFHSGGYDPVH